MSDAMVTYETFHGSAKKIAQIISDKLDCKCINADTPFEAEDLIKINTVILVFNFRKKIPCRSRKYIAEYSVKDFYKILHNELIKS